MAGRVFQVLGWCSLAACLLPVARAEDASARKLAERIDARIAAGWKAAGVRPAARADDAEFLRRVYLDIAGKIPPVSEARHFLGDQAADKRERLIESLLDGPAYVTHFSTRWRLLLVPETESNLRQRAALPMLEEWLRRQLAKNVGFDQLVRALLVTPLDDPRRSPNDPSPRAFFLGRETKPEDLAASATRLFLGVRLECAQCHNHPFAHWKREEFWSQAAFFASPERRDTAAATTLLTIPGTQKVVHARFLGGTDVSPDAERSPREVFADWVVRPDNPYFARAAVNRLWGHFFGAGLVNPVDDFTEANPPSHPELLDELAREFADHHFDVKFLIRALTLSNVYQLSGAAGESATGTPRLFSRMALKSLTPEQLFDSLAQATGYREPTSTRQRLLESGTPRQQFLARFPRNENPTDPSASIPQALAMMNGPLVARLTDLAESRTLSAVANAPFMDTRERVETLFLAALTRKPLADEAARFVPYVDRGGASGDYQGALADVFWALLNSGEFVLNH
jgi:hypothetical protein